MVSVSDQQVQVEVQGVGASVLSLQRDNVIASASGFPLVGQPAMVAIRSEKIVISDRINDRQDSVVEKTLQSA